MAEENHCPQCGAELPADAPQGMCPKCLMKLGLPTGAEADKAGASEPTSDVPTSATPPAGFVPPEPAELAKQFPQLEVLELLGQGGMGAVYKARQKQLDRLVALKILPPQVAQTEAFAERFTREARSLAKLSHPRIVSVHDFGHTEDGLYYFIMEFVDGTDLRHVIQAGELSAAEALAIVPQVCEALQFAHEEGIVHRDIKPENILLDKKGRVKIADFGLAKLLDRPATVYTLTQAGQRMGTPHYMAPEQIEHPGQVDHRADIFSLGVVFYEMLTGELPLGRFAPPSQKVQVDVRLDKVVLHSLEKEPERRYQHASEVKSDVEIISSEPKAPLQSTPRAPAPVRRRLRIPAIGLMISGAVNFLALALVLGVWFTLNVTSPILLVVMVMAFECVVGLVIILGAWQMLRLRSYGWAVACSVLAVLPLSAGFMLGFPMGVWALIVLYRSDTQEAFAGRKKEPDRSYQRAGEVRVGAADGIIQINRMEKHVDIVSALHIGFGIMGVLIAVIVFVAVVGGGRFSGDPEVMRITSIIGPSVSIWIMVVSVPGIICGVGLYKRKGWARILAQIVAIPYLVTSIPIGTIIGIYTIWVFLNKETAQLFVRASAGQKKERAVQTEQKRGKLVLAIVLIVAVFLLAWAFTLLMIFGWPVIFSSTSTRQSPQISVKSYSAPEQVGQLDLPYGTPEDLTFEPEGPTPYGTPEDLTFEPEGPTLSDQCIRTLELEPSEAVEVNNILRRAYRQYLELERQNTQQSRVGNILTVIICPFREEAERFLERVWADLDRILDEGKRALARRHLPLGQMFGTFQFGGPEVTIVIMEGFGTFIYSTVYKWPKGKSSIVSKSSVDMAGMGRTLPPEYRRFWQDSATTDK